MSPAELHALHKEHRRAVARFLMRRIRDPSIVDDLMQEVFIRLFRGPCLADLDKPLAYIFGIAHHVLADYMIDLNLYRGVIEPSADVFDETIENTPVPNDLDDRIDSEKCIDALLMTLPETHRNVIVLHKIFGMSYAECAIRLTLSIHTVEKYVTEAKRRMRHEINSGNQCLP